MFNVQVGALKNKNKHPLKVREPLVRERAVRSAWQEAQGGGGAAERLGSLQIEISDRARLLAAVTSKSHESD